MDWVEDCSVNFRQAAPFMSANFIAPKCTIKRSHIELSSLGLLLIDSVAS